MAKGMRVERWLCGQKTTSAGVPLTEACESGVGRMRAKEDSSSRLMLAIALVELKCCSLCFSPPNRKQHPSTSSMFEKTDPSSDACGRLNSGKRALRRGARIVDAMHR